MGEVADYGDMAPQAIPSEVFQERRKEIAERQFKIAEYIIKDLDDKLSVKGRRPKIKGYEGALAAVKTAKMLMGEDAGEGGGAKIIIQQFAREEKVVEVQQGEKPKET